MEAELPRILSPNLGCPFILSAEELHSKGFEVVLAAGGDFHPGRFSLSARPSYEGEGTVFSLELGDPRELKDGTLPEKFRTVEETRWLISTTLRASIFRGRARFWLCRARVPSPTGANLYREKGGSPRGTLYDLYLREGDQARGAALHALCLRPPQGRLRFIHLTDLHVALRNDIYADNLHQNITYPSFQRPERTAFNNFNENLRRFIRYANEQADQGRLDFVLMLGDLFDFLRHGFGEGEDFGENNCRIFMNLVTGAGNERDRGNGGLKVPLFTGTGNHDWRFHPYDVGVSPGPFGINREVAAQLDLFWADEQQEITRSLETAYAKILSEGSPLSSRTRWGKLLNWGLRYVEKWQVKLLTPLSGSAVAGFLNLIPGVTPWLQGRFGSQAFLIPSLLALVVIPLLMETVTGIIKGFVRRRIFNLLAIEAGWEALKDYFLGVNPFFNYAFRLGRNYFLVLDTGHDCIRARYLWDGGEKKIGPLSVLDNTIGQSPDSMAFYDANEYYPYSQIGWIQRLSELIQRQKSENEPPPRVFIGVHAPPANLSQGQARKAEKAAGDGRRGILLAEGEYDIRYGTINHYLSHFYHLCLGRIEEKPEAQPFSRVALVLAGHAHWKLEFRLAWSEEKRGPLVYFGDFTGKEERFREDFEEFHPYLLQTPACGPRESHSPSPPYFRFIDVDGQGKILTAKVLALRKRDDREEVAVDPFRSVAGGAQGEGG